MPTYHRSQRLRLVGTGPKVEQLQEGRFRLTFTCTATNPNEAWMNGNKDQIMTAYGTLQSAQKNIAGIDPRTDEAYSDMVLFRTEANPSERDLIITLVYETATTSFVKSQDDKIDFELNGLQRVTRVTIAKTGTTLPSVTIGTTEITVDGTACKLASRSVEENDAFIQITETYLESGITDVREDIIGSQKAIVITKVGSEPTRFEASEKSDITYDGGNDWSIARKDVSQEGGLKIYNYTFLLDNTVLSQSQDKQSSLKTEVIEVFNPKVTIDGLTVEGGSTVAGNYFLSVVQSNGRNQYFQSQGDIYPKTISYNGTSWRLTQQAGVYATSTDTNPDNPEYPPSTGWSGTGNNEVTQITIREFDQTLPNSLSGFELSHRYDKEGYSLINIQRSNLDGIPTMRYTFAKDNVLISQSEEKVGSQLAIVKEVFNGTPSTPSGYSIADEQESNVDGIPTRRFRFLKNNVTLSVTEDNIGSQNAIVNEVFNPSSETITGIDTDNSALSDYSEADRTESNYGGIKTIRVRFLKDNVVLSKSIDESRADKPEVIEYFKPSPGRLQDTTAENPNGVPTGKVLDSKVESNVDGIPTERYTFRKDGAILSINEDRIGAQQAVVVTKYNSDPTSSDVENFTEDSGLTYVIARKVKNGRERIFTFMETDSVLSKTVDNESPLLTEVIEYFKPASSRLDAYNSETNLGGIPIGFVLTNKTESNVDGIPTERYTFKKSGVILSRSYELVGSQEAVVISKFGTEPTIAEANTFGGAGYTIAKKEESGTTNQKTFTYTFLQSNVLLSVSEDKIGSQNAIVNEIFHPTDENADLSGLQITGKDAEGTDLDNHSEVDRTISDFAGIKTVRVRFLKNDVVLSRSKDSVGSQKAVVLEVFNGDNQASDASTYGAGSSYVLAKEEESNVDGIDTKRYTYLQPSILSRTDDKKDPACPITIVAFDKDETDSGIFASENAEVDSDIYVLVSKTERDFEGIETFEMRFEKILYFLSERKNEFGRIENVLVEQGGTYTLSTMPGNAISVNGTSNSYIIAQEITEGTVPRRTTTYSTAGIESVSEDLVGATKVITITSFITAPTTTNAATYSNDGSDTAADFVLISDTNNRVNGVDIFTYRFARKNAIVSTSFDAVGSQKAFVVEKFGETAPTTGDTINGVALSTYTLAKSDESNVDGIKTFRYTFLKPSIISVAQDFVEDINTIQVTAFDKTETQVKNDLSEVIAYDSEAPTDNHHKLISQRENNHDGITTTTYTFQINTSDIIEFTADDRLQVTRTIYEAHDYNYDSNYTVGTSTATVNGTVLALTSLRVDQRGTAGSFTKLTAVYTQPKIVTVSPIMTSLYNAVPMYQYRSIVTSAKAINTTATINDPTATINDPNGTNIQANAVFFEPSINNNTSPSTFTQNVLNTSTDLSVADSSVLISSHDDFYDFFYPGVVKITEKNIGFRNRISIDVKKTSYPVTSKVKCKVYNFIQRGDDIIESDYTYDGSSGLWSPNTWGEINFRHEQDVLLNGTKVAITAYNNSYNGYRVVGAPTVKEVIKYGANFSLIYYNGQDLGFTGLNRLYSIDIPSYGPPDPVGKFWCLNVDISPAFRDTGGNQYYNKQIVVTDRVPNIIPNKLTYAN